MVTHADGERLGNVDDLADNVMEVTQGGRQRLGSRFWWASEASGKSLRSELTRQKLIRDQT